MAGETIQVHTKDGTVWHISPSSTWEEFKRMMPQPDQQKKVIEEAKVRGVEKIQTVMVEEIGYRTLGKEQTGALLLYASFKVLSIEGIYMES